MRIVRIPLLVGIALLTLDAGASIPPVSEIPEAIANAKTREDFVQEAIKRFIGLCAVLYYIHVNSGGINENFG